MNQVIARTKAIFQSVTSKFGDDEEAATAIEYGLIAAAIAIAIIVSVFAVGGELSNLFGDIASRLGSSYS